MRNIVLPTLAVAAAFTVSCTEKKNDRPNIIYILADDLGYGDLGFLGQTKFPTPNIDALASQGRFYTQHYSGSPVSAPSRSCLVTGLHTGHTPIRGNKEMPVEGQQPLPEGIYTIFTLLGDSGYRTGVFGKWGLGAPGTEGAPENQGVDEFFGYNCQRLAHSYFPSHLWHNSRKIILEGNAGSAEGEYAPYLIHNQALSFIRENKDRPFFLWYTTTIPHAELRLPQEEIDKFTGRDELQPEKSYSGCDGGPMYKNGGYGSQKYAHAAYAAMVSVLDRQVGEICAELESLGIAENTIVVFTSDNGAHCEGGADPYFFDSNGPYRGLKRDVYEGGIRTPFIVKWPARIAPGTTSEHISAFWDFLPTVSEIVGTDVPVPVDGISFLADMTGAGNQMEHDFLYWEFHEAGGRQAVRQGDWKAVRNDLEHGGRIELYNLATDPGENEDLSEVFPEMVSRLDSLMKSSRTPSELFPFVIPD